MDRLDKLKARYEELEHEKELLRIDIERLEREEMVKRAVASARKQRNRRRYRWRVEAELTKLRMYFDANGVDYEVVRWEDNWYNLHVDLEYVKLSFLTAEGSYGGSQGLIEFYNFRDEPTGYLTAEEAFAIYEKEAAE